MGKFSQSISTRYTTFKMGLDKIGLRIFIHRFGYEKYRKYFLVKSCHSDPLFKAYLEAKPFNS